jgi:hypothetical protein
MTTTGQVALLAAQASLNLFGGSLTFAVASSAPTYVPGLAWINTSQSNALFLWTGSVWVNAKSRFLCLLTADPATSGPGGGPAVQVSDLVEVVTPGYARVGVSIGVASSTMPCVVTNTGLATWGPFTADMAVPAKWVAMVTVASGSAGILVYTWSGINEQVSASQNVQVPTGGLVLSQS